MDKNITSNNCYEKINNKTNDYCVKLSKELSECQNKLAYLKDDAVCKYFDLVYKIKCSAPIEK